MAATRQMPFFYIGARCQQQYLSVSINMRAVRRVITLSTRICSKIGLGRYAWDIRAEPGSNFGRGPDYKLFYVFRSSGKEIPGWYEKVG
jgi:hypothetical protein